MKERSNQPGRPRAFHWIGAILLLVLAGGLAAGAHYWKEQLRVSSIDVEGNTVVGAEDLVARSGISVGDLLFDVDLSSVRDRLMTHPFLADAYVRRNVPDRIILTAVERTPIAAILGDKMMFIDKSGFVLPLVTSGAVFDVPVISVPGFGGDLTPGTRIEEGPLRRALGVARMLDELEEVNQRISEIQVTAGGNLVLYTAERGIPVLVGEDDYAEKLASFLAFWRQVAMREDIRNLRLIDMRFDNQVVTRWKDS